MDIYLTNSKTSERFRVPLLPDRLSVKSGAAVISLNVVKTGEIKIPRGSTLTGYSWNGVFPGETRKGLNFLSEWKSPVQAVAILNRWRDAGDTLRLMVTDLSINDDVFIESFVYDYQGMGDVTYTLNLTKRRVITVTTVPGPPPAPAPTPVTPTPAPAPGGGGSSGTSGSTGNSSNKSSSSSGSYTVKSGDSLYSIAKAQLGDGARFAEIYSMNKAAIDAKNKGKNVSKYTVYAGMKLKLPARKASTTNPIASTIISAVSTVASAIASLVTKKPTATQVKVAKTPVKSSSGKPGSFTNMVN